MPLRPPRAFSITLVVPSLEITVLADSGMRPVRNDCGDDRNGAKVRADADMTSSPSPYDASRQPLPVQPLTLSYAESEADGHSSVSACSSDMLWPSSWASTGNTSSLTYNMPESLTLAPIVPR